jgi:hypothetical protein
MLNNLDMVNMDTLDDPGPFLYVKLLIHHVEVYTQPH